MMRHRKIKAEHTCGLCRAPVISRIGIAGPLGWVRLILDRFRGAACPHPDSSSPFMEILVWASSISNHLVLSAEVTGAFGADADNQARGRLVLAFLLISFSFGVS